MQEKKPTQLDKIRMVLSQECQVGQWVQSTTADCPLHGYWTKCIGVRVGTNSVDIWLEMDDCEETELHHVEPDDTIIVADEDPR